MLIWILGKFRILNLRIAISYTVTPPYYNSTATYNENNGWNETDENDLLTMLKQSNVRWALSNNLRTNPQLKAWAEENNYTIHYLNGGYGNCNYHKKDKETQDIEVLITNY